MDRQSQLMSSLIANFYTDLQDWSQMKSGIQDDVNRDQESSRMNYTSNQEGKKQAL